MWKGVTMKTDVKYPCRNCKYFTACGENTRTAPCAGRELKSKSDKTNVKGGKKNG